MSVAKHDVLEILVAQRPQWQSPLSVIGLLLLGRIRADPRAAGRLHHSPAPFRSILFGLRVRALHDRQDPIPKSAVSTR